MKKNYLKYSIVELSGDENFIRWVKGIDEENAGIWEEWIEQNPAKKADIEAAAKIVKAIAFKEHPQTDIDKNMLWNKINASTRKEAMPDAGRRKSSILRPAIWAAAATIAFFLIFKPFAGKETTIIAQSGEHVELVLPDQSSVTLNAGSEIGYFQKKWDESRDLNLKGEAFFNVKKGTRFTVHTKSGNVEVLGTSFNVLSRGDDFVVYCKTGKVKVSSLSGRAETILTPGRSASLSGNNKFEKTTVSDDHPVDWMRGVFKFEAQPLKVVFEEFERQYNVEIHSNESIDALRYTGSFNKDEFEKALNDIAWPMDLKTQVNGKTITITK